MLEANHFVVVRQMSREFLVRITSVGKHGDKFAGTIENGRDEGASIEAEAGDVIAYLGEHPDLGRVYSTSTVRLVSIDEHPVFGSVSWYWEVDTDLQKEMMGYVRDAFKILKNKALSYICDAFTLSVERIPRNLTPRTKVGWYRGNKNKDDADRPDNVCLKWHPSMESHNFIDTFLHETGHGFWYRVMDSKLRSKWVRAFIKTNKRTDTFSEKDMLKTLSAVWDNSLAASNESEDAMLGIMLAHVEALYGLRWKDIQLLYETSPGKLRKLFEHAATYGGYATERDTHITEYAGTNVEEYFCEAWRVFLRGQTLPASISDLMDETYVALRGKRLNLGTTSNDGQDDD